MADYIVTLGDGLTSVSRHYSADTAAEAVRDAVNDNGPRMRRLPDIEEPDGGPVAGYVVVNPRITWEFDVQYEEDWT